MLDLQGTQFNNLKASHALYDIKKIFTKSSTLSVQLFFLEEISRIEMFLKLLVLLNGSKENRN